MNANNYEQQKLRGLKRKYEAIVTRGGKCEVCGYNKNIAALEFHHKNPDQKDFQLDIRHFSNNSLEKLQVELDKCALLCANCHREIHNKDLYIDNIPELIKTAEDKKSFSNQNDYGSVCPVCNTRFPKAKGKVYCSDKCRDSIRYANYPSIEEVEERYVELGSWEKVAQSFNLTRKIIQGIRKRSTKE